MLVFVDITVPADGLAPLGARPSAGTVMTMFDFQACAGVALEMLIYHEVWLLQKPWKPFGFPFWPIICLHCLITGFKPEFMMPND